MNLNNLPNQITFVRIGMVPIFLLLISFPSPLFYQLAWFVFLFAVISDWLDGYLARKLHVCSEFGGILDPLADKFLVCSSLVLLSSTGLIPAWITATILCRELLVTQLRNSKKQGNFAANWKGKLKTIAQMICLILGISFLAWPQLVVIYSFLDFIFKFTLWLSLILTLTSGLSYCRAFFKQTILNN